MKNRIFSVQVVVTVLSVNCTIPGDVETYGTLELPGEYTSEELLKEAQEYYDNCHINSITKRLENRFYQFSEIDLMKYGKRLERSSKWPNHIS